MWKNLTGMSPEFNLKLITVFGVTCVLLEEWSTFVNIMYLIFISFPA